MWILSRVCHHAVLLHRRRHDDTGEKSLPKSRRMLTPVRIPITLHSTVQQDTRSEFCGRKKCRCEKPLDRDEGPPNHRRFCKASAPELEFFSSFIYLFVCETEGLRKRALLIDVGQRKIGLALAASEVCQESY